MVELGQLEKHHDEFAKRNIKVVAISNDDPPTAAATQADFPHLVIVADTQQHLAKAMQVIHPGAGPGQTDTNAPTTFLIDCAGTVRWLFRPGQVIARLSAEQLLNEIDAVQKQRSGSP
jgi:peroxiredoxin